MTFPKLWGKNKDGKRGFVVSHIEAIYYDWARKMLLSDKLGDLDRLIEEKVAKAMISNQQINDANHVPSSSLVYGMQQQISQINGDYVPKRMISGQFVNDTNKIPNSALVYNVNSALTTHKSSADHDGRYYTESEINAKIGNLQNQINGISDNIGRKTITFSYGSNIQHQAGSSFVSGNVICISECIAISSDIPAGTNIITSIKLSGSDINPQFAYGIIVQDVNSIVKRCILQNNVIKTEKALPKTDGSFPVILVFGMK